ncbi:hypothetical protein F4604DRAFT_1681247 [Suillus subluteus]|nr:hypothetical protein F4604DRAFT_1681247 [Suillus subluteus]
MNSVAVWFITDTVDAASCALVKEDPARGVAPAIFHDFQQMKAATQHLYTSTFTKSVLAGDLDAVVKDMTEEDRLRLEREKKEHAQEEKKQHEKEKEKEMRRIQRAFDRKA